MQLTDTQIHTMSHALRVAAERYIEHATTATEIPNMAGLVEQFTRQATEAHELADMLDSAEAVQITR